MDIHILYQYSEYTGQRPRLDRYIKPNCPGPNLHMYCLRLHITSNYNRVLIDYFGSDLISDLLNNHVIEAKYVGR